MSILEEYTHAKKFLKLNPITTTKIELKYNNENSIAIYSQMRAVKNTSFIADMKYKNQDISFISNEILYKFIIKDNSIKFFNRNTYIGQIDGETLDMLRNLTSLFNNNLYGSDSIAQSIFTIVSYEAAKQFEIDKLYNISKTDDLPEFIVLIPRTMLIINKNCKTCNLYINSLDDFASTKKVATYFENLIEKSRRKKFEILNNSKNNSYKPEFNYSEEEFCKIVEKAKEYITSGDIFQVVLSLECSIKTDLSPLEIFKKMTSKNNGTMNYLIEMDEFSLIGASPEILVEKIDTTCNIKPLAGTQFHNGSRDIIKEKELLSSEKDLAEHRMLVDLARNDLGRVCKYGTVIPKKLIEIEYYYKVMHIVSEIIGSIEQNKDCFDLFKSSYPAGTMTGAPKIRAMEIIAELENSARGFYSGGIGFFLGNSDMHMFINIRSMTYRNGIAKARAGSGIVYDSEPKMEYKECLNKLSNALNSLKGE